MNLSAPYVGHSWVLPTAIQTHIAGYRATAASTSALGGRANFKNGRGLSDRCGFCSAPYLAGRASGYRHCCREAYGRNVLVRVHYVRNPSIERAVGGLLGSGAIWGLYSWP